MTKQESLNTRINMLAMSFRNNTEDESISLLQTWSLEDLFALHGINELSMLFTVRDDTLEHHNKIILTVINDKASVLVDELEECIDKFKNTADKNDLCKRILDIKKQFPGDQWKVLLNHSKEIKRFFKNEWKTSSK